MFSINLGGMAPLLPVATPVARPTDINVYFQGARLKKFKLFGTRVVSAIFAKKQQFSVALPTP